MYDEMALKCLIYLYNKQRKMLRAVLVEEKRRKNANASKSHLGVLLSKQ